MQDPLISIPKINNKHVGLRQPHPYIQQVIEVANKRNLERSRGITMKNLPPGKCRLRIHFPSLSLGVHSLSGTNSLLSTLYLLNSPLTLKKKKRRLFPSLMIPLKTATSISLKTPLTSCYSSLKKGSLTVSCFSLSRNLHSFYS